VVSAVWRAGLVVGGDAVIEPGEAVTLNHVRC
jgi:hypothetical protein